MKGRIALLCLMSLATLLVACQNPKAADADRAKSDYDQAVSRAEKLGIPTSSKDTRTAIPDDQNAALSEAFDFRKTKSPNVDISLKPSVQDIEAAVNPFRESFDRIADASKLPYFRPPASPTSAQASGQISLLRSWTRFFLAKARLDFVQNRPDSATEDLLVATRLSNFAGQFQSYYATLVQVAIVFMTENQALDLVQNDNLSQKSIDVVRPAIQSFPELDFQKLTFSNIGQQMAQIEAQVRQQNNTAIAPDPDLKNSPVDPNAVLAEYLNNRCDVIEIVRTPGISLAQTYQKLAAYKAETQSKYPENDTTESVFHSIASPVIDADILNSILRMTAVRRVTLLGLDILTYKNSHGKLPQSLSDLKTKDSTVDPWSGKSLIYKVKGDRFVVYSVGQNGKDDDASPLPESSATSWAPDITFQTVDLARSLLTNGQ